MRRSKDAVSAMEIPSRRTVFIYLARSSINPRQGRGRSAGTFLVSALAGLFHILWMVALRRNCLQNIRLGSVCGLPLPPDHGRARMSCPRCPFPSSSLYDLPQSAVAFRSGGCGYPAHHSPVQLQAPPPGGVQFVGVSPRTEKEHHAARTGQTVAAPATQDAGHSRACRGLCPAYIDGTARCLTGWFG